MRLVGGENNLKHLSTVNTETHIFNSSCDFPCLKFKLSCRKTIGYLSASTVSESQCNFDQTQQIGISQDSGDILGMVDLFTIIYVKFLQGSMYQQEAQLSLRDRAMRRVN